MVCSVYGELYTVIALRVVVRKKGKQGLKGAIHCDCTESCGKEKG